MKYSFLVFSLLACANLASGSEVNESVEFDHATSGPKVFEPFEISGFDGRPIPLDENFVLEQSDSLKRAILNEAEIAADNLKKKGFSEVSRLTTKALEPVKLSVGEYLSEFNGAEKKLSSIGYSMKESSNIVANEFQKINLNKIKEQAQEAGEVYLQEKAQILLKRRDDALKKLNDLQEQAKNIMGPEGKVAVYLDSKGNECAEKRSNATTATESDVKCFIKEIEQAEAPLLSPEPPNCKADSPLGKAFLVNETWTDGGGDKNFGWNANANFNLNTDAGGVNVESKANASVTILNKTKEIITSSANFNTGRSGRASSRWSVFLLGKKVGSSEDTYDMSLVSSRNAEGKEKFIVNQDNSMFSQTFVVGFIPILVAVDSRVSTGPRYALDIAPVRILGKVEWVNKVTVIASAGVGGDLKLFVILAGIKGYIDLLNATVGAYPSAELVLDEKNRPRIGAELSALAELVTLSGQLDLGVWAKSTFSIPQAKKSFPFVEFKPLDYEWSQTLGRYPGYRFPTATLFHVKVGYDICSGRKQTEVIVANQPRPRDERESLLEKRNADVTALEARFKNSVEEAMNDQLSLQMMQDAEKMGMTVGKLNEELESKSKAILTTIAM